MSYFTRVTFSLTGILSISTDPVSNICTLTGKQTAHADLNFWVRQSDSWPRRINPWNDRKKGEKNLAGNQKLHCGIIAKQGQPNKKIKSSMPTYIMTTRCLNPTCHCSCRVRLRRGSHKYGTQWYVPLDLTCSYTVTEWEGKKKTYKVAGGRTTCVLQRDSVHGVITATRRKRWMSLHALQYIK